MPDRTNRDEPEAVQRIAGRYRVVGLLGRGGMSTVVRVLDEVTGREVALKRLLQDQGQPDDSATSVSLQREYHTLKQLEHPNIVEAFDFGIDQSGPYYTMELLEGGDLRDLAPMDWRGACGVLRDVASALLLLHSRRLLHRDVSPRNVRRTRDGQAKLIDFGALATIGVSMEVVGTPPFIPREALHGQPLDQRADIFGVGALAYWLITARHAYPATTLVGLEAAWRQIPELPSAIVAGVPSALDELIMAMLNIDMLARPSSMVEVITKLEVIGHLSTSNVEATAHAYLSHPMMTGRAAEVTLLRQRVRRAMQGRGGAVMIEAAPGLGRSRLLQETALDATLEGALVMRAQARVSGAEPYGVVRALVADLLASAPEQITQAAEAHLPILGHLFPVLHRARGGRSLPPLPHDAGELRARIQHTLRTWLTDVSRLRPLLIAVDDVHRADEPSAAMLASLALDARSLSLLIVTTVRSGAEIEAVAPVRALREYSARMVLSPLGPLDVGQLVRSLFGASPNLRRVSDWIEQMALGNPMRAMELLRDLVARQVIRYENGLWLMPVELSREALPRSLADALSARIDLLSDQARDVAEILSVCGERLAIELFVRVAGGDRARVFRALDELVMAQVFVGSAATYQFAQEGIREALLRALPLSRRREIHRSLGEALLTRAIDRPARRLQAGFHLLAGGAEERGAQLIVDATRGLGQASEILDLGPMFVAALEAALAVYESLDRDPAARVDLRIALARCAYLRDRHLLHHGLEAIEQLRRDSGLADAERMDAALSAADRVRAGKALALSRRGQADTADRVLLSDAAALQLITTVLSVMGVHAACLDADGLAHLCDVLKLWSEVEDDKLGLLVREVVVAALDRLRGRDANVGEQRHRLRSLLEQPDVSRRLSHELLLDLRAGSLHGVGMVEALEGQRALERAEELERMDSRSHACAALQIRMLKYLHDGDTVRAEECRERMEVLALDGGTSWHVDTLLPVYLAVAYSVSGDMLGLRRVIEQLAPLADELPGYAPYLWLARGAYHRERGELEESKAASLRALELGPAGEHAAWTRSVASYVQTLVAGREHARARRVADDALALCPSVGVNSAPLRWSLAPLVAIAEARVGETVAATRRLDAVILEAEAAGTAGVLLGRLHEARARVALLCADRAGFHEHLAATDRYFAAASDPLLVAIHARLYEDGMRAGADTPDRSLTDTSSPPGPAEDTRDLRVAVRVALATATRPRERAERALQILLENVGLSVGFLFLWKQDEMTLAAPLHGEEPPDGLQAEATNLALESRTLHDAGGQPPKRRRQWTRGRGESFQLLTLSAIVNSEPLVVAVLAFPLRGAVFSPPSSLLLRAVSDALLAAGDAQPTFAPDPLPR